MKTITHGCHKSTEYSFVTTISYGCHKSKEYKLVTTISYSRHKSAEYSFVTTITHCCHKSTEYSFVTTISYGYHKSTEYSFVTTITHVCHKTIFCGSSVRLRRHIRLVFPSHASIPLFSELSCRWQTNLILLLWILKRVTFSRRLSMLRISKDYNIYFQKKKKRSRVFLCLYFEIPCTTILRQQMYLLRL